MAASPFPAPRDPGPDGAAGGIAQRLRLAFWTMTLGSEAAMSFTACSGAFEEVYGVTPADACADPQNVFRLIDPDDLVEVQQAMYASMELDAPYWSRYRVSRPGNGSTWVEAHADPQRNPDGTTTWLGFTRTLSAREVMLIAQEEERGRLLGIVWSLDTGTWEWNLQTGAARLDQHWAGLLGYTVDDLRPLSLDTVRGLIHQSDRVGLDEVAARYFAGEADPFRLAVRMRHRDGHWAWIELRGRLSTRTPDGTPEWMAGIALDDSESKAAEEQMRTAFTYARSLIEASVDPLVTISVDGRIMDVNRATEAATGRARQDLIGSDFSEYFTDPAKARAVYQQVFSLGRVVDYPLTLEHTDGSRMEVLYNASTFRDPEDRVAGVFAAARDVTVVRRTQAELEATTREVLLLSQMSDLLQSCQTLDESLPIIAASMRELFPGSHGRGFLLDPVSTSLEQAMTWGDGPADDVTVMPGECWALRRNTMHEVNFGEALTPPCHYLADETAPYMCIPLMAQGTALGILHLVADPKALGPERIRHLARTTADSISLALANIRLRENLQALSTRDPLTGLYNRRFLEEALAREISRATRSRTTGVLAILDIDHFKRFNDDFGHDAGDAVLVAVAREMLGFREGSDLACRYGGEEFVIVLSAITAEDALRRLDGLRLAIAGLRAFHEGRALPPITISGGLVAFPRAGHDGADLITAADEALFRAKTGGRNRIEAAGTVALAQHHPQPDIAPV